MIKRWLLLSCLALLWPTTFGNVMIFPTDHLIGFPSPDYTFFYQPPLRRPPRTESSEMSPSQTVPTPTTGSKNEFTAIAFPPQVFEVLTGNEPTTQNLGGRKNATMAVTNNATTSTPPYNQVPPIISSANRPPPRLPTSSNGRPNQKPAQKPAVRPTTNTITTAMPYRPSTSSAPEKNEAAQSVPAESSEDTQFSDVVSSIRGVHQFLQCSLLQNNLGAGNNVQSNYLVSPLSVGLTMGHMLLAGGPRSKTYLREILRLYAKPDPNEEVRHELEFHKHLGELLRFIERQERTRTAWDQKIASYTLDSNTAIFVQTGLALQSTYIHSAESLYGSRLQLLSFRDDAYGSMAAINQWAEQSTRGKIKNFLSSPPSPNTAVLFASSLYFKAPWRTPFNEEFTKPDNFYVSPSETVTATFMNGEISEGSKYIDSSKFGVKALRLAYNQTDNVALYLILPKNASTNIHQLATNLLKPYGGTTNLVQRYDTAGLLANKNFQDPLPASWEAHKQATASVSLLHNRNELPDEKEHWLLDEVIDNMKDRNVLVVIPRTTIRGSLRLVPPGSNGKDSLAGILVEPGQALGSTSAETIIHETVLELTETGTEAAAVSAGSIDYIGGTQIFKANRPFIVLLRDEQNGLPLFWGVVTRPASTGLRRQPFYHG